MMTIDIKKLFIAGSVCCAVCAAPVLTSCSDFLDEPILGQQDMENYFATEEECASQVTGCYAYLACDDWWQIYKHYGLVDMCTDDEWMGNTTQEPGDYLPLSHYTGNTIEGGNAVQNFYQYRWKGILQCNIAILKTPEVAFNSESYKNRLIGEAKFLRAFMYFDLVRNFGGMPIIEGLLMPSELQGIERASQAETYAFIEQDLKDAIASLPLRSQYGASDMGRATKGAAQGLLAKVYLYQEKYQEAKAQLDAVISSGEYELLDDFSKVWNMDYNNSKEGLFEFQTNDDTRYGVGERFSVVTGSRDDSGWSWGGPTSNLEKAFKDAGDDIRLKYTIMRHGQTEVPGDPTWSEDNPYVISPSKHKSARANMKLYIPVAKRPSPYDAAHIPLNYRVLRYADVLLMKAEVENALGNDSEAQKALNQVRDRVNLDPVTSTGKTLRDAIRLELALEGNRLFDLRRWKDDNGKPAICNVMGPNGTFVRYNTVESTDEWELSNQNEASNKGYNFNETRDLLFPIPNAEITMSNGSIKQNPGYN